MDGRSFDDLARLVATSHSRRRLLRGLVGGAAGGLLGLAGVGAGAAVACRGAGRTCREDADCCSRTCGQDDRTGRRRCACRGGTAPCRNGCLPADGCCTNGDCAGLVDQCAKGVCDQDSGRCRRVVRTGARCDAGDPCTTDDRCQSDGTCAGTPRDCGDGLDCTDDGCDPAGGCVHTVRPGTCLIGGACYADGDRHPDTPCRVCAAGQDQTAWSAAPQGTACDDANPCTAGEACDGAGHCAAGVPVACPACLVCNPATGTCGADPGQNGHACDTGSLCERDAHCVDGTCRPSQIVFCGSPPDDCHRDGVCNPATGTCDYPVKPDGDSCTTDDRCVTGATCQSGVCSGGSPVVCDRPGPCQLAGTCNSAFGCVYPAVDDFTPCDDDNACTTDTYCRAGVCAGTAVACDTPNQCQEDDGYCDPVYGCIYTLKAAGTPCTVNPSCSTGDSCLAGQCIPGLSSCPCTGLMVCTETGCEPSFACPEGMYFDTRTCGCECLGNYQFCNGTCIPNCDLGSHLIPGTCECCKPYGSSCSPFGPAGECCIGVCQCADAFCNTFACL
jgi:hypothetical protein